jgi:hypothetical protein
LRNGWTPCAARSRASVESRKQEQANERIPAIRLKPGNEADFLGLLMPVIDAIRNEPTFINNFLHQDNKLATIHEPWGFPLKADTPPGRSWRGSVVVAAT